MAKTDETSSSTESWLQQLSERKPAVLIKEWSDLFQSLSSNQAVNAQQIEASLCVEIRNEPGLTYGWQISDKITGYRYVVAKQTTTKTTQQTLEFFWSKVSEVKAVVSLSLPDEGPLDKRGVAAFEDYSFWPLAKNERRTYTFAFSEAIHGRMVLTVGAIDTFGDESVVSKIDLESMTFSKQEDGILEKVVQSSREWLCHIQHLNWPPDGYPPMCTFSILRTITFIHQGSLFRTKAPFTIIITCSNGGDRSAAFAVLCCCVHRLDPKASLSNRASGIEVVRNIVKAIRARHPFTFRRRGTYLWLNYAVIEFCYASTMQQRKQKEEKRMCAWLLKLRKAVYAAAMADDVKS